MSTFTKEQLIEDLKTSSQNSGGMFEIGEGTICELMDLLTAPPAPVAVPTFDEWCERTEQKPVGWVRDAMKEAYDGCRAAMLQGAEPVTTDYKLPEGWVACSERMPEIGIKVLCFPVNDEPIHATYNGQVWLQDISWSTSDEPIDNVISCNVFHWMPLPAAPQQE